MIPVPFQINGKDKKFEYNFLKMYTYLNLVTNQRIIL